MKRESWPAELASIPFLQEYVEILAATSGIAMNRKLQLSIALEEVVMNVIQHAYAGSRRGEIGIEFEDRPSRVVIRIIDAGIPFDPLGVPEPDIGLDLKDRPIGGLGVLMVRKFMDEVIYERSEGENILSLVINKTE